MHTTYTPHNNGVCTRLFFHEISLKFSGWNIWITLRNQHLGVRSPFLLLCLVFLSSTNIGVFVNWYAELNFFCFITFMPVSDVTGIDDQELYDEEQENKFKKNWLLLHVRNPPGGPGGSYFEGSQTKTPKIKNQEPALVNPRIHGSLPTLWSILPTSWGSDWVCHKLGNVPVLRSGTFFGPQWLIGC